MASITGWLQPSPDSGRTQHIVASGFETDAIRTPHARPAIGICPKLRRANRLSPGVGCRRAAPAGAVLRQVGPDGQAECRPPPGGVARWAAWARRPQPISRAVVARPTVKRDVQSDFRLTSPTVLATLPASPPTTTRREQRVGTGAMIGPAMRDRVRTAPGPSPPLWIGFGTPSGRCQTGTTAGLAWCPAACPLVATPLPVPTIGHGTAPLGFVFLRCRIERVPEPCPFRWRPARCRPSAGRRHRWRPSFATAGGGVGRWYDVRGTAGPVEADPWVSRPQPGRPL